MVLGAAEEIFGELPDVVTAPVQAAELSAAMSNYKTRPAVRAIGIDTGKNTFHLIGLDKQGTIVPREKLARGRIARRLANASPCLIGIEAGMATHYARELLARGHDVRQIPPAYAKPFRQGHKNEIGQDIALDRGLRPRRSGCITMCWQPRSLTSWRALRGRS
jgi:transposase